MSKKKRKYIMELWFNSQLKNSKPNLVVQYVEIGITAKDYYFAIGEYSYNSITGKTNIEPLPDMDKLTFAEIENLLNGLPKNTIL